MTRPAVGAVLALTTTLLFLVISPADGAFDPLVWIPATILILGIGAVAAFALSGIPVPPTRLVAVAVAAFASFACWSYLTIAWADVRGIAWEGANRTAAYAICFTLFAALPLTARSGTAVVALFGVGATAIGAASVALGAFGLTEAMFPQGLGSRFAVPSEYPNASAAFFLMAVFAVLPLAATRSMPTLARAALLAVAGVGAQLALLAQSRAAPIAAALVAVAAVVIVGERVRLLIAILALVVAVGATAPALLAQTTAVIDRTGNLDAVADAVAVRLIAVFCALFLFGVMFSIVDARVTVVRPRLSRSPFVVGAVVVVFAALALGGVSAVDGISERARAALEPSRYGSAGSESRREEAWRAALDAWRDRPLGGIGADNFAAAYILRRETAADEPLYPHSLPIRVLTMTGIVGALLFATFALAAGAAALSSLRTGAERTRAVAAAAILPSVYWVVHGSVDWLWEIPALSFPAVALLALAGSLEARTHVRVPSDAGTKAKAALAGAGVAATIVLLVLPWLSARQVAAALSVWRENPRAAYAHLLQARRFDRLSEQADVTAGAIASRHGDVRSMRTAFARAVQRNPKNWYAQLALGVADAVSGNHASAVAHVDRAERLNPRDPVLRRFAETVRSGERVPLRELEAAYTPDGVSD